MSETVQIIPEKIQLNSIRILSGHITSDPSFDTNNVTGYHVQYAIRDEFYPKEKSFKFVLSVFINAIGKSDKPLEAKGEYSIEYIFVIENLEHYIAKNNDSDQRITIHRVLFHTLLSIVYSTSRGIVLSRTQGTFLDGVILPVIDTNSLLKQLEENKRQLEITEGKEEINPNP